MKSRGLKSFVIRPKVKKRNLKKILASESNIKDRFIKDYSELKKVVTDLKKQGKRIVLTQGVWDLIHEGHALYLELARSYGDILIVGVDSDALTKKRKGPNRPIVPQDERIKMLIHLRHVDIVTVREVHHDIGDLIRLIQPDVLIASESTKDFTRELINAYGPYCKQIAILPQQARSTTTGRIRSLTIEGAETLAREVNKIIRNFISQIKSG